MRGFALVGRVMPDKVIYVGLDASISGDDLLFFSVYKDGPMRDGWCRARDTLNRHVWHLTAEDHVFKATALGEHAFDPAPSTTAQ